MKKTFTLIELIIVIILISSVYYLTFTSSSFSFKQETKKVSIENIKEYLLDTFEFENKIELVCIEKEFQCFIKIDDTLDDKVVLKNLFKENTNADRNAASITDHQGIKKEKIKARTKVLIKLRIFLFI